MLYPQGQSLNILLTLLANKLKTIIYFSKKQFNIQHNTKGLQYKIIPKNWPETVFLCWGGWKIINKEETNAKITCQTN